MPFIFDPDAAESIEISDRVVESWPVYFPGVLVDDRNITTATLTIKRKSWVRRLRGSPSVFLQTYLIMRPKIPWWSALVASGKLIINVQLKRWRDGRDLNS